MELLKSITKLFNRKSMVKSNKKLDQAKERVKMFDAIKNMKVNAKDQDYECEKKFKEKNLKEHMNRVHQW